MEENIKEKSDSVSVYEVSYLLLPSLAETQVPGKADDLKNMLTSLGGSIISFENPILIDLVYRMTKVVQASRHKVSEGYFGWIKFEIGTDGVEKIKKALDLDLDIVRYLIIRTVKENTLLNGKMKLGREEKSRPSSLEDEESVEVVPKEVESSSEEIDKSIDDLVIA